MTILSSFIEQISKDGRKMAVLAAVGLASVLVAPHAASAADRGAFRNVPRIMVTEPSQIVAINERLSDQLEGMRTFNVALHNSLNSYASQSLSGLQKAKNLAMAFDATIRQAEHDDLAFTDRGLIAPLAGADPQQLNELIGTINEKKRTLVEFASTVAEVEKAYAKGDEKGVYYWSQRFAHLAGQAEGALYEDTTPAGLDWNAQNPETPRP